MKKAYLVLANGKVFEGYRFGAEGNTVGELVFTTGVVGYLETLTDPSYCGQIILQTFPLIGNYGVMEEDCEGKCFAAGYVVREWCEAPSNFRCQYDIDKYLKDQGIPGIYGIDTRELTSIIRDEGSMNATICDEIPTALDSIKSYKIENALASVATGEREIVRAENGAKYNIALVNYGAKHNIAAEFTNRGCDVTVLPYDALADEIMECGIDGVVLSAGPGDPRDNKAQIEEIAKIAGKRPILGIGLGHQMLALAMGGKVEKLVHGHRGSNQPAKAADGKRTYITSQNHGYEVLADSLAGKANVTFINANDNSCEGLEYPEISAYSVQFEPATLGGTHDSAFVFDKFIEIIENNKGGDR